MSIKTPTTKPTISIARRPRNAGRFSCGRIPSPAATTGACFCNVRHGPAAAPARAIQEQKMGEGNEQRKKR
jgi:hypothetical protein